MGPSKTISLEDKAEGLLKELQDMEHTTKEIIKQAKGQNLGAIVRAAECLATFMKKDCHPNWRLL